MLIILEGCDGAGKTTLADQLADEMVRRGMAPKRYSRGPLKDHPLIEYERALDWYRPNENEHVICDRWHLGELVYGPLLRGESKLDPAMHRHIELFLQARGALIVHVSHWKPEVIKARLRQRGDDLVDDTQVVSIMQGYSRLPRYMPWFEAHQIREEDRVERILAAADRAEEAARWTGSIPTYVGSPEPEFILVGEVRHRGPESLESSAFVPYLATSGHFLLTALPRPLMKASFGMFNATEVKDAWQVWYALGVPPIVALGNVAHAVLEDADVQHSAVPHPQFIRRFHHKHQVEYGLLIKEAIEEPQDLRSWRP